MERHIEFYRVCRSHVARFFLNESKLSTVLAAKK